MKDTSETSRTLFMAIRHGHVTVNGVLSPPGSGLLYHLNLALERIDRGEFGLCVGCGKEINAERLEAVPHARLCIECKSKEERQKNK